MKIFLRSILGVLAISTIFRGSAPPFHEHQNIGANDPFAAVAELIETGDLGIVEILGVPPDDEFRIRVTPERLEKWWNYKLTIRDLDTEKLLIVLRSAAPQRLTMKADFLEVRSGIAFYSKSKAGMRIACFYFDRSGRRGIIDGIPLSFNEDFLTRLKKAVTSWSPVH